MGEQDVSIYRSDPTVVTRSTSMVPRGVVRTVRTVRIGADAHRRVAHEARILQSLSGAPGVPRLVPGATDADLVVEDVDGVTVADLVSAAQDGSGTPWRFAELLDLAIELTAVIGEVHRRGVVHLDICPANVVVHGPDRRPMLVDFEFATVLTDEWHRVGNDTEITGTLAYLAPEQTGRTGRPVDQRTDLYALGATFYELASGRPPFGRGDDGALDLIHDHLAVQPKPLSVVCPDLPEAFSDVVSRLLEKEPDLRYQSAEGLLHDLRLLRSQLELSRPGTAGALSSGGAGATASAPMRLGTRDFPLRFRAPAHPVAREDALGQQAAVFAEALEGRARALLVSGPAGTGKTALVDQLRPVVTRASGRLVTTTFTGDGAGHGVDAGIQAVRAVGRLLLAESESDLLAHRERLLDVLGDKAGLVAGVLPEFEVLLATAPEPLAADPVQVQAAVVQAGLDVLRAVTTPERPLVLVLDGVQWATGFALDLLDGVLTGPAVAGLLLVAAFRDDELEAPHPLTAMMLRWERLAATPAHVRLRDLSVAELADLLAEVLRIDVAAAAELAVPVHQHTAGNPYDTLELLNALRRDGALSPGSDGWVWDTSRIHRYAGAGEPTDLLAARVADLPRPSYELLAVVASLGGEVDLALMAAATQTDPTVVRRDLGPLLADGLLASGATGDLQGGDTLRLRHDRVRQVVLDRMDAGERRARHLRIARLLADRPDYRLLAAEQYLSAVDDLADRAERDRVVDLFADVATELRVTSPATAERCLGAAVALLAGSGGDGDDGTDGTDGEAGRRLTLTVARHAALYSLGRFEEADAIYESLSAQPTDGLELFAAGAVQIASLTNRARPQEAVWLGFDLLGRLGLQVPDADHLGDTVARELDELYAWVDEDDAVADLARPEITDPRVQAAATIVSVVMAPAFFSDPAALAWLVLESRRIWAEHGPCRALVAPLCHAAVVTISQREDFTVGYRVVRRVLDASIARGYEPETSRARFLFAVSAGHWFEPLESVLDEARLARDGLLTGGDSQGAVFTYHSITPTQLDLATGLEEYLSTVESGLTLAARSGNDQTVAAAVPYRELVAALRGRQGAPGTPVDTVPVVDAQTNPMAAVNGHLTRALAAAVLGDHETLVQHARAAVPLLPFLCGHYAMSRVHLLRALAAAEELRRARAGGGDTAAPLADLDDARGWLAARAKDSPATFAHLLSLVEAERAWAVGDTAMARRAFDRALRQVAQLARPWHLAYTLERAGLFTMEQGEEYTGGVLLGRATRAYAAWGAAAKVEQLQRAHPFLRGAQKAVATAGRSTMVGITTDALDLLSVLEASQALSRETDLDELRARVVDVLTAMTGATSVAVLLRASDGGWVPPAAAAGSGSPAPGCPPQPQAADLAEVVPLSVVRYAERTREPVVVADTTTDHRFTADPYLVGAGNRSLLVVPILSRGEPSVMLVLENRLQRGVFSADRLDAVMLIAGQLAVSFDIALAQRQLELEADRRLQLLGTLRSREHLLETLLAIQRDISHRAPLQTVLDAITAGASGLLGGDYVALVLADPTSSSLPRVPSMSGTSAGPDLDALVVAVATESIAADAMVSRGEHSGPEVGLRPAADSSSLTAAPVHVSGEIIGSLVTRTADDGANLAERQDLLTAFAEQVSLALNDATTLEAIRAASLDGLTGLATRRLFMERLEAAMKRHSGNVTVLFIDMDRFKQVNDSLGHEAGDQLLTGVAERVRRCIRDADTGARLGGDEFAILLEGTPTEHAGLRVGEALTAALLQPFRIAGKEIFATASVGVAVAREDGTTAAELLRQADIAMYQAKRERTRRPVLFEPQMHEDVSKRLDLEGDLERAVASGQLWLQFQPQVRLDDLRVTGVEALVRWTHPVRGPISPAEFIPIAEDTGVVADLGRWVLAEACRQVAQWRRTVHPTLTCSVNVSGRQLTDSLAGEVASILAGTGLDADALTLELTESVLLADPAKSVARLEELKSLGVLLALDDFGTGYSSLSYLHRFRVDELKIDKSFVDKIGNSHADLAIVRAVLELARILELRTIAEGVETQEQWDLLAGLGCRVGQGYLFARPLSSDDVPAFLARHLLPHQIAPESLQAEGIPSSRTTA